MADKKKFEIPEITDETTPEELAEYRAAAQAEVDRLNEASDEDFDVDAVEPVLAHIDAIDARTQVIEAAATERAERIAAARARAAEVERREEESVEEAEPAEEESEVQPEEKVEEPVVASGTRRPTVARAASKAPAVIIHKEEDEPTRRTTSVTAAANVPDFNSGQALGGMDEVAAAFLARVGSFGGSNPKDMKSGTYKLSPRAQRYGVARIRREVGEFEVTPEMPQEAQFSTLLEASKDPGIDALTAAGGWCAPSETIYDLFGYETNEGLISVPEVTARRGGISFTKGPDFMTIFADSDAGFIQTETEAEAGTTKPCYALECPPFTEVRLDAVGFCATAPLLTDAAWPELVRRTLNLLGLGHARRKSQSTINRISALIGTAINWGEIGGTKASGVADVLAGLELQAMRIRQSLAMSTNAVIEGVAPHWLKAAFRNELSRRLGLAEPFRVTDADVEGWLAVRNIRLQFVYDYQMLTTTNTSTWTAYPTTVDVMLWPAGAFTRLVHDVINLDAVYDHELLTGNEYTAAFVEEGIAVANTRGYGVKVAIALQYNGSAGFPAIGTGSGVTFT